MKILQGERGSGKTTELIKQSYLQGIPIVVFSITQEEFVLHKAKQMGLNIPNPISITKLINRDGRGLSMPPEVLVDELDHVLESCIKAKVKFATTSSSVISIDNLNKIIA